MDSLGRVKALGLSWLQAYSNFSNSSMEAPRVWRFCGEATRSSGLVEAARSVLRREFMAFRPDPALRKAFLGFFASSMVDSSVAREGKGEAFGISFLGGGARMLGADLFRS